MRGFFTVFCCVLLMHSSAQRTCLTDIIPGNFVEGESQQGDHSRDTISNEIITIPVVIHILYNESHQNISTAQVLSQLQVLNEDFRMMNADASMVPAAFKGKMADARIRFCLAKVDPNGRSTSGIIRKYTNVNPFIAADAMKFTASGGDDAWDSNKYLNIWVCNMFGRSLGYATMPGGPKDKDGVVINFDVFGRTGFLRAPFNKGRTATHEVAHWMGLKHIWGDALCGSDDVDDTPPQKSYNYYCPSFPKLSSCSSDGSGDMFMNFMDLTDDACMNMFTHGQSKKMRGVFAVGGVRNAMLNSIVCDSSYATGGPLPEAGPIVEEEPEPVVDISVFPNPVREQLYISGVNGFELSGATIIIHSAQGQIVKKQVLHAPGKAQVDITGLKPGVYILSIDHNGFKKRSRIVKI